VDLAGLEWSTGSGSRRCGKEQSCGRHGGEDGAARWGRDVSGGGSAFAAERGAGLAGALRSGPDRAERAGPGKRPSCCASGGEAGLRRGPGLGCGRWFGPRGKGWTGLR